MVESFTWNEYTWWGAVAFEKLVKQFQWDHLLYGVKKIILACTTDQWDSPENIALFFSLLKRGWGRLEMRLIKAT